ncbi:hypothetical protein HDZ31DRAFT_32463 [Schizophyllum fasciatum]
MPALNKPEKKATSEREWLAQLKREHHERPLYSTHARNQERTADEATPEVQAIWFKNMKEVMHEIDWATDGEVLPREGPMNFLDLGCCPGGFSSYVLEKNPDATGVGVSLPSGHEYLLENELRARHELLWADLLQYDVRSAPVAAAVGFVDLPWGLRCRQFDLVILDGHPLRSQKATTNSVGPRLLVTQLLLALRTVRYGGALIVKLSGVDRPDTQAVLWALDALATRLTAYKPVSMHATRDTFYAVAEGVFMEGWVGVDVDGGCGARVLRVEDVVAGLEARWAAATFGKGKRIEEVGMWAAVGCEGTERMAFKKRLNKLVEQVVRVQRRALEGLAEDERSRGAA